MFNLILRHHKYADFEFEMLLTEKHTMGHPPGAGWILRPVHNGGRRPDRTGDADRLCRQHPYNPSRKAGKLLGNRQGEGSKYR